MSIETPWLRNLWMLALSVAVSLGVLSCSSPPSPCARLSVGAEIVFTIEGTGDAGTSSSCDLDELGLTVGSQLVMVVEDHLEAYGVDGRQTCSPAIGRTEFDSDTGWVYEPRETRSVTYGIFGSTSFATKDGCGSLLSTVFSMESDFRLSTTPSPAGVIVRFSSTNAASCSSGCSGKLMGSAYRAK